MFTPLVRLRDIFERAFPAGTSILAGAGGLEREVHWAISLRWNPPAFPGLRPSEIVLVSLEGLRRSHTGVTDLHLVQRMAEKSVACVVVDGTISAEAVARAEGAGLVVLQVPEGTRLAELESEINRAVSEARSDQYRASLEVSNSLTRAAALGSGACPVVAALAETTGLPAAYLDAYGTLHCRAGDGWVGLASGWEMAVLQKARGQAEAYEVEWGPVRLWACPVRDGNHLHGLVVCLSSGNLSPLQQWALNRAALACALARSRSPGRAERRRQLAEFVGRVLKETALNPEILLDQGRYLGVDLSQPFFVGVGRPSGTVLLDIAWQVCDDMGGGCACEVDAQVVLVCPGEESRAIGSIYRAGDGGANAFWGFSSSRGGIEGLRKAYREARLAARAAAATGRHHVRYAEAGPWTALGDIATSTAESYFKSVLGPLEEYDRRRHLGLLETLEAYLEANGQIAEAARKLNIHRNSMIYRIKRLQEISGYDLSSYADLFELQLALALRKLARA